jgi:hypothetical protein
MTPLVAAQVDELECAIAADPSDITARERVLRLLMVRRFHEPAHHLTGSPWGHLLPSEQLIWADFNREVRWRAAASLLAPPSVRWRRQSCSSHPPARFSFVRERELRARCRRTDV